MTKEHPVFRLIHSLEVAEKAYFKKFAFKKESKNNSSFKRLFDIIDKQATFDIDKIIADKKINDAIKARVHVNLNHLQKKIMQSILDYRKEKDKLSLIFEHILEIEFFRERNLNILAEKKYNSLNKLTANNDYFLLKPFIHFLPIEMIRSQVHKTTDKIKKQMAVYDFHVEDFYVLSETRMLGLQIENIFKDNSGILIKNKEDVILAKELIIKTNELLGLQKKDFQLKNILTNNLFILTIMVGKYKDFDTVAQTILDIYYENMNSKTVATELYDFLIIIVNLSFTLIFNEDQTDFEKCIDILKKELPNIKKKDFKMTLKDQIFSLENQNIAINKRATISLVEIEEIERIGVELNKKMKFYMANINYILQMLFSKQKYDKVLELSIDIIQEPSSLEQKRSYYAIKIIRALAWLAKENIQMFDFEIQSVYKFVIQTKSSDYVIQIVNFIKGLAKKPSHKEIHEKVTKLKIKLDNIKENATASEFFTAKLYYSFIEDIV